MRNVVSQFMAILLCLSMSSGLQAQDESLPRVAPDKADLNLVTRVTPVYPPLAKTIGLQAVIHLDILIDETGAVKDIRLISGHPILAPSAIEAIKQWKYKPFEIDGKPTTVRTDVKVLMPATATREEIASEHNFQQKFWENERLGKAAYDERRFDDAEAKLAIARAAAEERGDSKWLELAGVITLQGHIAMDQGQLDKAKDFYAESLALHLKHQRPNEAEVAGAQQDLGILFMLRHETERAEPLFSASVETYLARLEDTQMKEAKASYGRHLAVGYFALSQIARTGGRDSDMRDGCQKAITYAQAWSKTPEKDTIIDTCSSLLK